MVQETLQKGNKIMLAGFGTWDVQEVSARTGRNPRTGEPLKIHFNAGSELLGKVSKEIDLLEHFYIKTTC